MLEGVSDHCGGTESGSTGTVLSPNFPANYPNNAGCVWRLTTRTGNVCSVILWLSQSFWNWTK